MSKLRSVNTHFWNDNYIVDLDPVEKLLFLYLLTNEQTNMLGIYELNLRRISFDTGIDKDMVLKIFKRFEDNGKAKYNNGFVILPNFIKNQKFNGNMETSATKSWNLLPLEIRLDTFCEPIIKGIESFTKGSEPIAEIEREYEIEIETETESKNPTLTDVVSYFLANGYTKETAEKAYKYYNEAGWKDGNGKKVINWKQKMQGVWFRDEHKKNNNQSTYIDAGTF
jgi:hypothetical protein